MVFKKREEIEEQDQQKFKEILEKTDEIFRILKSINCRAKKRSITIYLNSKIHKEGVWV